MFIFTIEFSAIFGFLWLWVSPSISNTVTAVPVSTVRLGIHVVQDLTKGILEQLSAICFVSCCSAEVQLRCWSENLLHFSVLRDTKWIVCEGKDLPGGVKQTERRTFCPMSKSWFSGKLFEGYYCQLPCCFQKFLRRILISIINFVLQFSESKLNLAYSGILVLFCRRHSSISVVCVNKSH